MRSPKAGVWIYILYNYVPWEDSVQGYAYMLTTNLSPVFEAFHLYADFSPPLSPTLQPSLQFILHAAARLFSNSIFITSIPLKTFLLPDNYKGSQNYP